MWVKIYVSLFEHDGLSGILVDVILDDYLLLLVVDLQGL